MNFVRTQALQSYHSALYPVKGFLLLFSQLSFQKKEPRDNLLTNWSPEVLVNVRCIDNYYSRCDEVLQGVKGNNSYYFWTFIYATPVNVLQRVTDTVDTGLDCPIYNSPTGYPRPRSLLI